jgi:RNA polymerase sigma-70 factor (ECF subfamily)
VKIDDDKILLIALRERKERAFDMIVHKYLNRIYHFVRLHCKPEEAEDLTQDIFVKLWKNSQTVEIESLKGYLYTLAKGVIVDWTRRSVNQMVFETLIEEQYVVPAAEAVDEKIAFDQLLSVIHQIAETMPKRRFEVFRLKWVEGLTRKEIAQRMGITITTVDIQLKKAVDYLRLVVSNLPDSQYFLCCIFIFL